MKSDARNLPFFDPSRLVAVFAFLFGNFWIIAIIRKVIEHGNAHWLFLPGIVIWLAWGTIAIGCGSGRFCRATWIVSAVWHGLLSAFSVVMVIALGGLPLIFAPLEIVWVIAITIVSISILYAGAEPLAETGANKAE